ncbi:MAG: TetR family transcriptional regulator C-terminal domain-containing protein [Rickettsiales bacterium]|nr:TetR family transcriptional regulator C-terminal domain-containing protein [Rickettsiales bacterium]
MSRANVKDKRKAQLIAAALESIAKRGLMETTITHISKGAGMSRGIINFYFTSKETMLRETLKTLIDEYEVEWGEALAKSSDEGRARVDALIAVHFGKKLCSARRLNVMSAFWGHAASQAAYRNQLEAADAKIENTLTAALAHTLGGSLDEARDAATQLHALIRGLWLNFMLNPKDAAREVLALQAASFIDRLTGAPVRIVRDHIIARPAKPEVTSVMPKAKTLRKAKEPAQQQLDIEDLFGNRA